MDVGKGYLINYDMFSKSNHKFNVALMLHRISRDEVFPRSELIGYLFQGIVETFCEQYFVPKPPLTNLKNSQIIFVLANHVRIIVLTVKFSAKQPEVI